jgi:hypothetical protein
MKKKRTPKKPSTRQELRPYPGFSVRVTVDTGVPTPAFLKHMIVKGGGT